LASTPKEATAFPFFSRQVGRDCAFCHSLFPRLNEDGRVFLSKGFRFDEQGIPSVKDMPSLPASVEVEIEGFYRGTEASGARGEAYDVKIEELEVITGGAMGRNGVVSALGVLAASEGEDGSVAVGVHQAFVRINDIAGGPGLGHLNISAGRRTGGLVFMSPHNSVLGAPYLSDSLLDVLREVDEGIELNGIFYGKDYEGAPDHTHRYSLGLSREATSGENRLKGYYLTYSATIKDAWSVGFMYRKGYDPSGEPLAGLGLAGEFDAGPLIITAGYFSADMTIGKINNYMLEAVAMPVLKTSLGLRYDIADLSGGGMVASYTVMGRYDILSNVYAKMEFTRTADVDNVLSEADSENEARFVITAVY
jgi:hypothetical protein